MKKRLYLWASEALAQFIEGASDAFLIVTGGSTIAHAGAAALPSVTLRELTLSVLLGGAIYVASYLKKNPLPSSQASTPPATPAAS